MKGWKKLFIGREEGSVMEFVSFGMVILGFITVLMVYLGCVELLSVKGKVSQISRKYILKMESVGCLEEADKYRLQNELTELGMSRIDLSGSTLEPVGYGEVIVLNIKGYVIGKLDNRKGEFLLKERRESTAKY